MRHLEVCSIERNMSGEDERRLIIYSAKLQSLYKVCRDQCLEAKRYFTSEDIDVDILDQAWKIAMMKTKYV